MAESKKHHYVPQSMLRRFSSDAKQLFVFDKRTDGTYPSSVLNAGSENHFNTVDIEGETINFESLFQSNDDAVAALFNEMAEKRSVAHLTPGGRKDLSAIVAAQIVRTKLFRTSMRELSIQFAASLKEGGIDPDTVQGAAIPDEQQIRFAALESFLDVPALTGALDNKLPLLIHSSAPKGFWISDNPVVLHNPFPYGEKGLSSPGVVVYLPVSSDLVLALLCPTLENTFQQAIQERPSHVGTPWQRILDGLRTGSPATLGKNTDRFLNRLQISSSHRFLYAATDDFEFARETLKQAPYFRNVESLASVGKLGDGPPRKPNMPPGTWAVIYGRSSHHMITAKPLDDDESGDIVFDTFDAATLSAICSDTPLRQASIFRDGFEYRHMKASQIHVADRGTSFRVTVWCPVIRGIRKAVS